MTATSSPIEKPFDFAALHARQERHAVLPPIPVDRLMQWGREEAVAKVNARQEIIDDMADDPLLHGYDPPHWRLIDLMVARKRLEHPGACLEIFVLGGHDSGKTNGWTMRIVRHFWFTKNAWVWGLHSTEPMSITVQQARVWTYFPLAQKQRVNARGGMSSALDQKMKYTEGGGFTNMAFNLRRAWRVPWSDKPQRCGGKFEFKVYGGQVANLQGSKLTAATSDELIDKDVSKTVKQRIIPRAADTAEPWFLEVVRRCEAHLSDMDANGFPRRALPPEMQGLLYTGVHGMGFTPMDGYSPLVAGALDGSTVLMDRDAVVDVPVDTVVPDCFPCEEIPVVARSSGPGVPGSMPPATTQATPGSMPPATTQATPGSMPPATRKRVTLLPVFGEDGKVKGCQRVPVFRQPVMKTQLVCYLPTNANPWTNIGGKLADMDGAAEDYIRVTWFGDVRKQWDTLFAIFDARKHVIPWSRVSRKGTITEVIDPGARKPWAIGHFLTDPSGRHTMLQEWPCPGIAINGFMPGAWAVTSEHGLRNGDAGPAQKLKLNWGRAHYLHLLWQLRMRLLKRFAETGDPFQGSIEKHTLTWQDRESWKLEGEFAMPYRKLLDSRFAAQHTETRGETKPLIDALYYEENAIDFEPSSGVDLSEGDTQIINELADNGLGMPGLQFVDECENTIFTMGTYAVPETSDKPTRRDDKCKDFRDLVAYFILSGPEFVNPKTPFISGGGTP